jgi:hypothetical protein
MIKEGLVSDETLFSMDNNATILSSLGGFQAEDLTNPPLC